MTKPILRISWRRQPARQRKIRVAAFSSPRFAGSFRLGVTQFTEKTRGSVQNIPVADAHGQVTATGNSSPQERVMSIRIATATLLAAVLATANIADAGTSSHRRQASMPERSWTADYAPAYLSRYAPASQVTPGRGSFEEHISAP
jgi:hypothetical protein